jgi:multicomponent Na+:H+ antiporter subunit E
MSSTNVHTRRLAALSLTLLVVWIALDGLGALWLGLPVSVAGGLAGRALLGPGPFAMHPLRLARFGAWFLAASWRSGLDVARRAFARDPKLDPGFHRYHHALPPGPPLTLFVSALSLLPGTLSAEPLPTQRALVVHALTPAAFASVAELEARVRLLFALPPRTP